MEFFIKNKIVILRTLGAMMLIVGFSVHFWTVPKEGLSANAKAAANVARMEARAAGKSGQAASKKSDSKYLEEFKNIQAKQLEYLTIFAMLFGVGFLGYSFMPKKEEA